ncbi:NAD(P)H-binding protein [Aquimarina sp. MMG016]|uniref:NAD(P)H-binding protein n=1 Tax=Aquimarina sp. MMG016 TaxID=2822690 RepID=UPI001B3A6AD1|nr:NAD(P)H-binding protein [Aquimarina sp. MMG016]MBQ4821864.1 NAD(P)H-binding protein [Aquimarina sp. MMG016]
MNIIVGASGQVGTHLINRLSQKGVPTVAVVRDPNKVKSSNIQIRQADLFVTDQVVNAFEGGTTAFLLTPENPTSNDIIGDTSRIVENYRIAVEKNGIKRIVCLSSIGAHLEGKTGNLLMSRILEQGFNELNIEKIIVRPSYYFSNWLGYYDTVEQYGVLPTFFPGDLKISMHSPIDLADFLANIIAKPDQTGTTKVYELVGQEKYNSQDIAKAFSTILRKDVFAQSIPSHKWKETLMSVGFTENTANNLIDMTQTVIDGRTIPEFPNETIELNTTIESYLKTQLRK